MKKTYRGLSLLFAGLLLLAAACSGPGANDKRDQAITDDPTKPLESAITGKVIAECLGHEDAVTGVAVSPDATLAVSSSRDWTLRFWSFPEGRLIRTIRAAKPPNNSCCIGPPFFSADGKTVAALVQSLEKESSKLCLWDTATGEELPRCVPIEGIATWTMSPDGERVARVIDEDCVRVWNTREGKMVREFRFRKGERVLPAALSFSPDGKLFAVGLVQRERIDGELPLSGTRPSQSASSKVRVWEVRTGELVFASETLPLTREARWIQRPDGEWESIPEKQPYGAGTVAFSPDRTRLAASGADIDGDTAIWVWDLATRKLVQKLAVGEPFDSSLAFSPDGHMLACGTGACEKRPAPEIQIWNLSSGKLLGSLEKHTGTVTGAVWGRDGRTLVSCGQDRRVLIWRLEPR